MAIVKCKCLECRKEFKLKVQDCCSQKCASKRREDKRRKKTSNKKLINVANYLKSR